MKKQFIGVGLILMLFMVLLTGCTQQKVPKNGDVKLINTELIGGEYNVSIIYKQAYWNGRWQDNAEIRYTKNEIEYQGFYSPDLKDTLDWIKTNTSENCTILCWWDYAKMIEGYAERNVIARFCSLALTDTIAIFGSLDEEGKRKFIEENEWTSNETIKELAMVLTSTNISSNDTKEIMEKFNVSYIFTKSYDTNIAWVFFKAAGKNVSEYVINNVPNVKGNETLIFKLWNDVPEILGLELVYNYISNDTSANNMNNVRIFKVVNS